MRGRGQWAYLYRAVDKLGNTIAFYLSPTRNTAAARRFLGKPSEPLIADFAHLSRNLQQSFARKAADQVVFMDQGQVVEAGPPEAIFDHPQSPRLRRFLSEVL